MKLFGCNDNYIWIIVLIILFFCCSQNGCGNSCVADTSCDCGC